MEGARGVGKSSFNSRLNMRKVFMSRVGIEKTWHLIYSKKPYNIPYKYIAIYQKYDRL